ncbi:MAG TPA: DUF3592 domain-containing protein, partial [Tepidisphaeraceae bacterium]|nr:DUF3592 domain-containing protein [Tepidisphaeraceae bacterium]
MAKSTNRPGCVGLIVFGMLILIGGLATVTMVLESTSGPTLQGWPTAPATIVRSEVHAKNGVFGPYSPDVAFEYAVNEKPYRSDRFAQHTIAEDDYTEVARLLAGYPVGGTAMCFYDPADPAIAVLHGEPSLPLLAALFPLLFVIVGLGGLLMMLRKRRAYPAHEPAARSLNRPNPASGPATGAIVFSAFMVMGFIVSLVWSKPALEEIIRARSWNAVEATIINSRVRSHRGDDSTTYSVDVVYDYVVDGRNYRANRLDLVGGSSSGRQSK